MEGIPPVRKEDVDDVVWALQTADSHWKRNERSDALLWLKRAAEAAGDANDDARALMLAREAQLLSAYVDAAAIEDDVRPPPLPMAVPVSLEETVPRGVEVVSDPFGAQFEAPTARGSTVPPTEDYVDDYVEDDDDAHLVTKVRKQAKSSDSFDRAPEIVAHDEEISSTTMKVVEDAELVDEDELVGLADRVAEDARASVPPMIADLDDLEASLPLQSEVVNEGPTRRFALLEEDSRGARSAASRASDRPTSPPPDPQLAEDLLAKVAPPPIPGRKPPPMKPAKPLAPPGLPKVPGLPQKPAMPPLGKPPTLSVPGTKRVEAPRAIPSEAPPTARRDGPLPTPTATLTPQIDLNGIGAFKELSDEARVVLANSAEVQDLSCDDEVGSFAMALVIAGEADVAATIVDASALRLEEGRVLCARGTMADNVPMRLICASDDAKIATWNDDAMVTAFRSVPWVLDKLKEEGDLTQALVGITVGPLGERLDADLRDGVLGRLKLRRIRPGEVIVEKGKALPGVIVVGVGEITLSDGETVQPGDFLFPLQIMGSGPAPATATGGKNGALVMFGDRMVAQELLVTCPPLLEILSS